MKRFSVGDRVEIVGRSVDPRKCFGVVVSEFGFAGERVVVITEEGERLNVETRILVGKEQ
jgi:hypothetical protein